MKKSQPSLFDTEQPISNGTDIKIRAKNETNVLSKAQKDFNTLTEKIASTQKKCVQKESEFEDLIKLYTNKLHPVKIEFLNNLKNLIITLNAKKNTFFLNLTKTENQNLSNIILHNLMNYFELDEDGIETQVELKNIYLKLKGTTEEKESEDAKNHEINVAKDFIKFLGLKINLSDYGANKDEIYENLSEIHARIDEEKNKKFNFSHEKNENFEKTRSQKKSKKQIEKELKEQEIEDAKSKNIGTIYKQLAKLLHPDLEQDPILKLEKEELMKEVSVAYQNKDMHKLLLLEMKWVQKENENIATLTDEKLKIYNEILREQLEDVCQRLYEIEYNPRYQQIEDFICKSFKNSVSSMMKTEMAYKFKVNAVATRVESLKTTTSSDLKNIISSQMRGSSNIIYILESM